MRMSRIFNRGSNVFKFLLKILEIFKAGLTNVVAGRLPHLLASSGVARTVLVRLPLKSKRWVSASLTIDIWYCVLVSSCELFRLTATGTPLDSSLSEGQKLFVLGFFSVTLEKALDASDGANS